MCLTTGCRTSEALPWQHVDLERSVAWLHETKNGDSHALAPVSDVKAALAGARKVRAFGSDYVFFDPRHPDRPKNLDMCWRAVRKRAGVWQARDDPLDRVVLAPGAPHSGDQAGPLREAPCQVQAVTGHKTPAMLSPYPHLDTDDSVAWPNGCWGSRARSRSAGASKAPRESP
jgi:integrase